MVSGRGRWSKLGQTYVFFWTHGIKSMVAGRGRWSKLGQKYIFFHRVNQEMTVQDSANPCGVGTFTNTLMLRKLRGR
jgi:hypothetical protein